LQGIEVNPDTLAVDVIREIGPGGEYLTHEHTAKHFRSEQWDAELGNRLTRDHWEEKGAMDIRAKARDKFKKILATHQPKPLAPEVRKKLQHIVDQAEA